MIHNSKSNRMTILRNWPFRLIKNKIIFLSPDNPHDGASHVQPNVTFWSCSHCASEIVMKSLMLIFFVSPICYICYIYMIIIVTNCFKVKLCTFNWCMVETNSTYDLNNIHNIAKFQLSLTFAHEHINQRPGVNMLCFTKTTTAV